MYAPSKGFRSYPEFGIKRQLPRELGISSCTLANPDGISEPEGLRTVIGNWSDGTPIEEASILLSKRFWAEFVRSLREAHNAKDSSRLVIKNVSADSLLASLAGKAESVISTENRLSRNAQKAAKHRVQTIVAIRAKRLLKLDPSLDPLEAMSLAETQYAANLALQESRGKPSYQYATPRYDTHCLRYQLQDNSKSRTISSGNGFRRLAKQA